MSYLKHEIFTNLKRSADLTKIKQSRQQKNCRKIDSLSNNRLNMKIGESEGNTERKKSSCFPISSKF